MSDLDRLNERVDRLRTVSEHACVCEALLSAYDTLLELDHAEPQCQHQWIRVKDTTLNDITGSILVWCPTCNEQSQYDV